MEHAKYRNTLPQLDGRFMLTDGGLETTMIFHEGIDLPLFAAFDMLRTVDGRTKLKAYYRRHAAIALDFGTGFVLDSPTWRASRDWGSQLGYSETALAAVNREAIELMHEIRDELERPANPFVVSGNIGPRGDGYSVGDAMTVTEARDYHLPQLSVFADAGADMATVLTMTYAEEATGIVKAASQVNLPIVTSFTVETDGNLPSGQPLAEAIAQVDTDTNGAAVYFMINCAHPTHFFDAVSRGENWTNRIRGLRVNASRMSHEELDNAEQLDDGNPFELGREMAELKRLLPQLVVLGGCCGTDHRHIESIGHNCCHRHAA